MRHSNKVTLKDIHIAHKRLIKEYKNRKIFMQTNKDNSSECTLYDKIHMTGMYSINREKKPWYYHYL